MSTAVKHPTLLTEYKLRLLTYDYNNSLIRMATPNNSPNHDGYDPESESACEPGPTGRHQDDVVIA